MKKSLIILLVAFGVFGVLIFNLSRPGKSWRPNTRLTFIGFTNLTTRTNALFAITNLPTEGPTSWILREVSHREGTNWKAWDHLSPIPFGVDWYRPSPTNLDFYAAVPVETTTEPSHIVIELKLHPEGAARFFEDVRGRWASFRGRDEESAWRGPSFFITNETDAVPSRPAEQ